MTNDDLTTQKPTPSPRLCLLCKKPAVYAYRPFCSKRCQQIDLGMWFSEKYVIPGEATASEEDS